jgi:hypothetical protein
VRYYPEASAIVLAAYRTLKPGNMSCTRRRCEITAGAL